MKKAEKKATKKTSIKMKKVNVHKEVSKIKGMAKEYAEDKEKTKHLLNEALKKARKNEGQLKDVWDNLMVLFRMVRAVAIELVDTSLRFYLCYVSQNKGLCLPQVVNS